MSQDKKVRQPGSHPTDNFEEIDERRIERSSLDKWTEDWFKNHVNQQAERIKELEAYIQKLLDDGDNEARIADFHQRLP